MVGNRFDEEFENVASVDSSGNLVLPSGMGLTLTDTALTITAGGLTVTAGTTTIGGALAVNDDMTIADAKNIIVNATTGTKIGTATTQKLGFYNATPVAQPSAYTQTYSTADKTHAARTAAAITDSSGGTASQTLAAITGGGAGCENATKNAVASIADDLNKLRTDHLDTASVVNSLVDDLQALGLVG